MCWQRITLIQVKSCLACCPIVSIFRKKKLSKFLTKSYVHRLKIAPLSKKTKRHFRSKLTIGLGDIIIQPHNYTIIALNSEIFFICTETWREQWIRKPNLKDLSSKIALQHPDDRSSFPIAYSIKYLIYFINMIYVHLKIIDYKTHDMHINMQG